MRLSVDMSVLGERFTSAAPSRILLTAGSAWAHATRLPLDLGTAELEDALRAVSTSAGYPAACELFRGGTPGCRVFFGARASVGGSTRTIEMLAALLATARDAGPGCGVLEALRLLVPDENLFASVEALELGIVDRWTEAGPVEWRADELARDTAGLAGRAARPRALKLGTIRTIAGELAGRAAHLWRGQEGPVAVEFRFMGGLDHWVGVECARVGYDGRWELDRAALEAALHEVLLGVS